MHFSMFCAALTAQVTRWTLGFEPHARHAHRLLHALLAVDHVFLRQDVEHLLIRRNGHGLRRVDHPLDVLLEHLAISYRDDAVGVEAADVASGDSSVDLV